MWNVQFQDGNSSNGMQILDPPLRNPMTGYGADSHDPNKKKDKEEPHIHGTWVHCTTNVCVQQMNCQDLMS